MTLDGSGNLLVGKTSPDSTTVGVEARGSGILTATRDSGTPVFFGRNTTDGSILTFQKGSTTVGSIGASGNEIFIGSPNSGGTYLRLGGGGFYPATSTGANSDNTTNIGDPAVRFKDLYLSGGVYLGGTGSANKLDDYEEGTWTPVIEFGGNSVGVTYSVQSGRYTKVGDVVTFYMQVNLTARGTSTGAVRFTGFPFNSVSAATSVSILTGQLSSVDDIQAFIDTGEGLNLESRNTGTQSSLTHSNVNSNSSFYASGIYYTSL